MSKDLIYDYNWEMDSKFIYAIEIKETKEFDSSILSLSKIGIMGENLR